MKRSYALNSLGGSGVCAVCRATRACLLAVGVSLWFAGLSPVFALNPERDIRHYNVRTWTRHNGLPATGVNALAQTADGYLWIGTSSGLVRFDGTEFKAVALVDAKVPDPSVHGLAARPEGGLWAGLGRGFGFFDGETFSFRGAEIGEAGNMKVRAIVETSDRTLWIAGEGHALRRPAGGDYDVVLRSSDRVTHDLFFAFPDSQGRVWFGTASQGARYWRAGEMSVVADPDLSAALLLSCAEDRDGDFWFGTHVGLFRYDRALRKKEFLLAGQGIQALFVDRAGALWIGTRGKGVVRHHRGQFSPALTKVDGLADDFVNAFVEDREGNLWIGTRNGLTSVGDIKFPTYPAAEDTTVQDAIAVAASARGGIWIGSSVGVTHFNGAHRTFGADAGLPATWVKRVLEAGDGDLYLVCGSTQLAIMSAGRVVAVHDARDQIVGMAEDARGVVVSIGGALYRASRAGLEPYAYLDHRTPELHWALNLTAGRDGALWVACINGLFRVKDGAFQHWSEPEGLVSRTVYALCEDPDGVIWAATQLGLGRLKDGRVRTITHSDGLFANNLYGLAADAFGFLWIDSDQGIFRVSRRSLHDFADGRAARVECVAYDGSEAVLPANKTAQERVAATSTDGRIWFPTSRGVVAIDPAAIPANRMAPPVQIERVVANGRLLPRGGPAVVEPGKGELEFHFTAPSFVAPEKIVFRYRLDGYDQAWVETTSRRTANYTNLPPGRYAFRVMAANADGVWNEGGDTRSIELRPHFHQTGWFYVLCVGAAAAGIAGVFWWRVRLMAAKQRALQEARDRLETEVQARTAELAGHAHALEAEIEQRKRMQVEIERVHRQLLDASREAGMAEVATSVLHNVGNVLNSVNVAATVVIDQITTSKSSHLAKVNALLREHAGDLGEFFTRDPRGKQIPGFLGKLAEAIANEQKEAIEELGHLRRHIEHIREIVAMQQSYARVSGVVETLPAAELVEDALRINAAAMERHRVAVVREFETRPLIAVERHKVLQILVNLIRNSIHACDDSARPDKQITVRLTAAGNGLSIAVIDNGVGIPPENLTRIFSHGFTTRKNGHGFGLHSGALTAKELGGSLSARSPGRDLGATFMLDLPLEPLAAHRDEARRPRSPASPGEATVPAAKPQTLETPSAVLPR